MNPKAYVAALLCRLDHLKTQYLLKRLDEVNHKIECQTVWGYMPRPRPKAVR